MNKQNLVSVMIMVAMFAAIFGLMCLGMKIANENPTADKPPILFSACVVGGLILAFFMVQPDRIDAWVRQHIAPPQKKEKVKLILIHGGRSGKLQG